MLKAAGRGTRNDDQVKAYCWANGLIEITKRSVPAGAILLVAGQRKAVREELDVSARHGMGAWSGKLIVPGVPEAADQHEAGDALSKFIGWRSRNARPGLTWNTERSTVKDVKPPKAQVELLEWLDASTSKPDADILQLLWIADADGHCDWDAGWWTGEEWLLAESGGSVAGTVLFYASPEGPEAAQ